MKYFAIVYANYWYFSKLTLILLVCLVIAEMCSLPWPSRLKFLLSLGFQKRAVTTCLACLMQISTAFWSSLRAKREMDPPQLFTSRSLRLCCLWNNPCNSCSYQYTAYPLSPLSEPVIMQYTASRVLSMASMRWRRICRDVRLSDGKLALFPSDTSGGK